MQKSKRFYIQRNISKSTIPGAVKNGQRSWRQNTTEVFTTRPKRMQMTKHTDIQDEFLHVEAVNIGGIEWVV